MGEALPVIITIVTTAVGATWIVTHYLASIATALAVLTSRFTALEADVVDLQKARVQLRPRPRNR